MSQENFFSPGYNCWRVESAQRAAFLIDGEAYFSAVREAMRLAQHSILILGWDLNSQTFLPPKDPDGLPESLGEFLNMLVKRRKALHIHVLIWDFAFIYAAEREWFLFYKLNWKSHKRLHFYTDNRHPAGASHHQKVIVIDDAVAFSGGFDLTQSRWDTPAHMPNDPRRRNPNGLSYPPFHDIQMAVDGAAAAALGELARTRWQRATGKSIATPPARKEVPWPAGLAPDLENVKIAIARTQPPYEEIAEIREVERLYLDMINAAQRWIYIENQYLSSNIIREALSARLQEERGPEVVMVLCQETGGWLEKRTMDVLRSRLLVKLRAADRYGRLRTYHPHLPRLEGCMTVHGKIMIIDNEIARVASSNLSNRSMGLDTECDLAVAASGDPRLQTAIAHFRNRLLGEQLNVNPETIAQELERRGSLIAAIEALRTPARSLQELDGRVPEELDRQVPSSAVLDPERPLNPEDLASYFMPRLQQKRARGRAFRFVIFLMTGLILVAVWQWWPAHNEMGAEIIETINLLQQIPATPLAVLAAFIIGGLLGLPVMLLIMAAAILCGPLLGFVYSMIGVLLSAALTFVLGKSLKRDTVRRLAGWRINRVSQRLARRGLPALISVRIFPLAPFTIVNLIAGASRVRFKDFLLGTLIGMLPGAFLLSLFADHLITAIRSPRPANFMMLALLGLFLIGLIVAFNWWLRFKTPKAA